MIIKCPHCATEYDVSKSEYGSYVKCEKCRKGFVIGQAPAAKNPYEEKGRPLASLSYYNDNLLCIIAVLVLIILAIVISWCLTPAHAIAIVWSVFFVATISFTWKVSCATIDITCDALAETNTRNVSTITRVLAKIMLFIGAFISFGIILLIEMLIVTTRSNKIR